MKHLILTDNQKEQLAELLQRMDEKKKKTHSIYDQVKGVNSVYMSQAAGIGGILGENDATDDQYEIGKEIGGDYAHIMEETNPDSIDLSSFNVHDNLNPRFWKNERLDSRIRMRLLDIADDFWEFVGVNWVEVEDVIMTGSLANFNWDKQYSDIDLHLLVDFKKVDKKTTFVKEYFDAKKNLWNDEHDKIMIAGFPVEVYIQDVKEKHAATAVYSLDKDKWIKEPDIDKLSDKDLHPDEVKHQASTFMNIIDELEENLDDAKTEYDYRKVKEKGDDLFKEIKKMRQDSLKSHDGEINDGNIVFKTLRRNGYLDKLYDIRTNAYDLMISLKESTIKS